MRIGLFLTANIKLFLFYLVAIDKDKCFPYDTPDIQHILYHLVIYPS